MELLERALYFTIGGGVGFILGYIAARLQNIEKKVDDVQNEVHDVDELVKKKRDQHRRDDRGFVRYPHVLDVALIVVIGITLFAAFSAAKTNSELDTTVACLTKFNTEQNVALIARDQAIKISAEAEIDLWGLYNKLYKEGTLPNTSEDRIQELQETLANAIADYREKLITTQESRELYEYGEPDVIKNCEEEEEES